jgi:MFS family permease
MGVLRESRVLLVAGSAQPVRRQMTALRKSLSLLFSRRFGTFWFANLLSNMGSWTQQVAEPWLLLSIGASSFVIGLDAFAMASPAWLLTLVGGVLADRGDRRRVIATYQSIQMLCPTILVALLLAGVVQPWMVVALSLVVGITDALSMPSFQTIVPSIVGRDQIAAALALNATQFNLSRILGPALAGLLMASLGAVACFSINAASYIPFILVALWILPRGRPASGTDHLDAGSARRPLTGFQDILRRPKLRGALVTVFLTSLLCGPLIVFCPILIKDVLHGGVTGFGGAMGAFGLGGLLGALVLLAVDPAVDRRQLSSWFAIGYGVIVMLAALTPWLWGLAGLLILAGLSMNISNTSANTLLQAAAPARLLGQTVSLYMLALRGGVSVGSFVTGITVGVVGVREALLLNGGLAVIAQLIVLQQRRRRSSGKPAT